MHMRSREQASLSGPFYFMLNVEEKHAEAITDRCEYALLLSCISDGIEHPSPAVDVFIL